MYVYGIIPSVRGEEASHELYVTAIHHTYASHCPPPLQIAQTEVG